MKFSISPDPIPGGHAGIDARLKLGPRIHPTAYVVPGATVIGDVTLMEESSVWYGAVLRGDINRIIIGPRSNVQDNAVVHIDTPNETRLGELVTVGHSAIVHACIIDDEVLIGMGAIILDGAEIGARSIIGANALVTLGTKIPPGSLVLGSPAKVKRALTLEEQKDIARWAWSYVETSKHFREFYSRDDGERRLPACSRRQLADDTIKSLNAIQKVLGKLADRTRAGKAACAPRIRNTINVSELTPVLAPVPATTHAPAE